MSERWILLVKTALTDVFIETWKDNSAGDGIKRLLYTSRKITPHRATLLIKQERSLFQKRKENTVLTILPRNESSGDRNVWCMLLNFNMSSPHLHPELNKAPSNNWKNVHANTYIDLRVIMAKKQTSRTSLIMLHMHYFPSSVPMLGINSSKWPPGLVIPLRADELPLHAFKQTQLSSLSSFFSRNTSTWIYTGKCGGALQNKNVCWDVQLLTEKQVFFFPFRRTSPRPSSLCGAPRDELCRASALHEYKRIAYFNNGLFTEVLHVVRRAVKR